MHSKRCQTVLVLAIVAFGPFAGVSSADTIVLKDGSVYHGLKVSRYDGKTHTLHVERDGVSVAIQVAEVESVEFDRSNPRDKTAAPSEGAEGDMGTESAPEEVTEGWSDEDLYSDLPGIRDSSEGANAVEKAAYVPRWKGQGATKALTTKKESRKTTAEKAPTKTTQTRSRTKHKDASKKSDREISKSDTEKTRERSRQSSGERSPSSGQSGGSQSRFEGFRSGGYGGSTGSSGNLSQDEF